MKNILINGEKLFYTIERKKVKNINMRLSDDGIVKISANKRVSEKYIRSVLEKHGQKFIDGVHRLREKKSRQENTGTTKLLGKEYPVRITESSIERAEFDGSVFTVFTEDTDDTENILFLIMQYKLSVFKTICEKLNLEVYELFRSKGFNVPLSVVSIKIMKTRWGSCSYTRGHISMNLRLMDHPYECIYGVFCHEYTHYIYHDHSPAFHRFLNEIYPEYEKYDRLLKNDT